MVNPNAKRNRGIIAFAKANDGDWSWQLIADEFGVTRNVIAGLMFRQRHPPSARVCSPNSSRSRNKVGTGHRGPGCSPTYTAQNSR